MVVWWCLPALRTLPTRQSLFPSHSTAINSKAMELQGTNSSSFEASDYDWLSECSLCDCAVIATWLPTGLWMLGFLKTLLILYTLWLYFYTILHLSHSFGNFYPGEDHGLCMIGFLCCAVLSDFIIRETCRIRETCQKPMEVINFWLPNEVKCILMVSINEMLWEIS